MDWIALSIGALWVFVIVLGVAVLALYHHFGEMYMSSREGRMNLGPKVGSRLPDRTVRGVYGDTIDLPPRRNSITVFTSVRCQLCEKLRPEILTFAAARPDLAVTMVCAGRPDEVRTWSGELGHAIQVVADPGGQIATDHRASLLPFLIASDQHGVVRARGLVNDGKGLQMAAEALDGKPTASAPAATEVVV